MLSVEQNERLTKERNDSNSNASEAVDQIKELNDELSAIRLPGPQTHSRSPTVEHFREGKCIPNVRANDAEC